jgi:hypothetical protein
MSYRYTHLSKDADPLMEICHNIATILGCVSSSVDFVTYVVRGGILYSLAIELQQTKK